MPGRIGISLQYVLTAAVCFFFAQLPAIAQSAQSPAKGKSVAPSETVPQRLQKYGELPLSFEPNHGQADSKVKFLSRAAGQTLLLKQAEAVLLLQKKQGAENKNVSVSALRIKFAHANPGVKLSPQDQQSGVSNYLIGNVAANWHTGIPNYSRVVYRSLYQGVDLIFYGNEGHLEYDFEVAPGADSRQIRLDLAGAKKIRVAEDGMVNIDMPAGSIHFSAPTMYQVRDGRRIEVAGRFERAGDHQLRFAAPEYDKSLPLIIDPVLSYSTYLAGSSGELGAGIAVDASGNAYITGLTFSTDFPTAHSFQANCGNCGGGANVFITKLNATGTGLIFSTFLGGTGYDQAKSIAIDGNGNVIVGGTTSSSDFPIKNPIQTPPAYYTQGFIASLAANGASLNFSTYLGGTGGASVATVTTDSAGNVYSSGLTDAADFPITPASNVIGVAPGYPLNDMFVAKMNSAGKLIFATSIGPDPQQQQFNTIFYPASGNGIAVDSDQSVYLAGAASQGFLVTPGAFQTNYIGPQPYCGTCTMAFLAKLKPDGSAFSYATYLGGSGGDQITGLALDTSRNAYVTGNTSSQDFPTTPGVLQPTFPANPYGSACCQSFVTKVDPTGEALVFSTFLGGAFGYGFGLSGTQASGIAIDANGEPFVTGITTAINFPLKNPVQATLPNGMYGGSAPATYVTQLNSTATAVLFSTLFSGSTSAQAAAISLDGAKSAKSAYITGTTYDTDLPTTPGAFQTTVATPPPYTSSDHVFVTKFDLVTAAPVICADQNSLYLYASVNSDSYPAPVTLTNCGNALLTISHIDVSGIFTQTNTCQSAIAVGQACSINVAFHPVARGSFSGTLTINSNAPIQPLKISVQAQAVAPVVQLSTNVMQFDDLLVGTKGSPVPLFVFNQGDDLLQISAVTLIGKDFAVDSSGCAAPVQPGSLCVIFVTFSPLAAGPRNGSISLKDNAQDSPQSVTLQGNGLLVYPSPVLTSVNPSAVLQGGAGQSLVVYGSYFFPSSRIRINGVQIATTYNGESTLVAAIPVEFLGHLGNLQIDVATPAPGGGLSSAQDVLIYQDLPLSANDLIFEPYTRQIFASVSANAPQHPNSIVSLDPESELVGQYSAVGNGPNRLAVSNDGKFLYVGLDNDRAVQQFATTTRTVGAAVPLPSDPSYGNSLTPYEIHVVPGRNQDYVVSLSQYGYPAGVSLISNGKLASYLLNTTSQGVGVSSLCFLSDPTAFYGSNGYQLQRFEIQDHTTLTLAASMPAPQNLNSQFACDEKFLYSFSGLVLDPAANQVLGTYPFLQGSFGSAVYPDSSIGRTFFLTYGQTSFPAFDQTTFAQLGSIPLPQNFFEPYRLIRWGTDGFAFLNYNYSGSGNDVILLRSGLADPSPGPNPKPKLHSFSPQVKQDNGNFQLTVEGGNFVPGAVVQWNGANRTTIFHSSSELAADIPAVDVSQAGEALISVVNPPKGGGESNKLGYSIKPAALVSITITPANLAISKGNQQQLSAVGTYTDGSQTDLTNKVVWSSGNKTVAAVSSGGLVTALATGAATVKAAAGALSGSEGLIVYIGNFFANSSSNYQAVVTGHTTSYNISVVPVAGFSADVTLSVAGMPKGATTSFSPSAVVKSGSGSATLTISADTTTTLGLYTLTITAAAGSLTHSVQVGLGVNSSPGSFSVAISPNPIPWVAGTDGLGGVVSITPDGGFTGDVALSLSGVPVGLEPGFYGNVVTGGSGAAYLFLLVDPGTAPGNYTFTITGTSGALVSSTKVVVTVSSQ